MEILIFGLGVVTGGVFAVVLQKINNKNDKNYTDEMLNQMKLYFENTANKVFQESSDNLTEQNREKLDEFFKRFKDRIEDFEKRTDEKFKTENENFTKLDVNIKNFIEEGSKISQYTSNLINVMKSDNKTSGKWGEIVLERVLETSGLRRGEEFEIQKGTAEGRPDAIVRLPENRCVFIDSKTSFSSWDGYVNSTDETEKENYRKDFITSTKSHITELSKRNYAQDEQSPDYVLMFIPIEGCYSMMFCDDCALWDFAWKNKVMPVSPSTLLASLKIISAFHRIDKQNRNILEMAKLCTSVHDKFCVLLADLLKARELLTGSIKKLEGHDNIISKVEKLETLGATVTKQLPEISEELRS